MLKKRGVWLLFFLLSLVFILTACGREDASQDEAEVEVPEGTVILEFWNGFTGPDGNDIRKMIEEFNQEFDGEIHVKSQTMPWDTFYDRIRTVVRQGQAPDIAVMHLDTIAQWANFGVLEPIDDLVADLGLEEEDFIPQVWEAGIFEGQRYGIPLDVHPLVLYYNIDLLAEAGYDAPPTTYDEFVKMAQAMTKGDQWGFGMPTLWPSHMIYFSSLYSHGGKAIEEDGITPAFYTEEGIEALQKLVDLVHKYEVSPKDIQQDGEVTLFRQGKMAFHINGIWMINGFLEQEGLNFATAPIPAFGDKHAVWAGSHQFVFPKQQDKNPEKMEAAMTFVKWITNNSLQWAKAGQLPAKVSVLESEEFKALVHQANAAQTIEYIVFPPFSPYFHDAWGPSSEAVNLAVLGQKEPSEALKEAYERGKREALEASQGN